MRLDLIGKRFGLLTVVAFAGVENQRTIWTCRCDCGTEAKNVRGYVLKSGLTKSCGCLTGGKTIHGLSDTRMHEKWASMKRRCEDPKHHEYKNYGARGIKVCDRWKNFEHFLADMGEPPPGRTLDRIDNDGDYEPSNCRWATNAEQGRNRRNNRLITFKGETKIALDWAIAFGMHPSTLASRLNVGWPIEKALTMPICAQKRGSRAKSSLKEDKDMK